MLPTPSGFLGDMFVQVTTILGVVSSCCDVMKLVRVAAVGAIMAWRVVPSVSVAVVLISIHLGGSAIIITCEAFVKFGICS